MIGEKLLHQKQISLNEVKQLLAERKKEKDLSYEQDLTLKYAKKFSKLSAASSEKLQAELRKIVGLGDAVVVKMVDILPEKKEILQLLLPKESKLNEQTLDKILALVKKYKK